MVVISMRFVREKNSEQKMGGFNNNFDFDDCRHEHPEFLVPGN